jgi:uncharacterized Zn-binding protein involved in type VI secretion
MFPAARVGDQTASGDTVVGPGVPTVLIAGQPAAVMGDQVKGPTCQQSGSIVAGSATVLIQNRPAARVTSAVQGSMQVGPAVVPTATTIAKGAPTVLIGG